MKRIGRITAAFTATALLLALLVSCGGSYSYMKQKLGKYIRIEQSDYLGVPVTLTKSYSVEESDIDGAIEQLRYNGRELYRSGITTGCLGLGDVAYLFYWGTYEKNGRPVQFSGGTNMTGTESELALGSGSFVGEFEHELFGVFPNSTGRTYTATAGTAVAAGSIVYLDIESYQYDDGNNNLTTGSFSGLRVDLSDPGILGEDFAGKLVGMKVGDTVNFGFTTGAENDRVSIDWNGDGEKNEKIALFGSVVGVASSESSVEVKAVFPDDYGTESLRGVEATFHVIVTRMDDYTVPGLSESLIIATFPDFTAGEEELAPAFRAYLSDVLAKEKAEERTADIEDAIWDYMAEHAEFTGKYPKKGLEENYQSAYDQMIYEYQYYGNILSQQYGYSVPTLDDFAKNMYELADGETWKDYLDELSRDMTKEKLIIYSIVKAEGWQLTEEEYKSGADPILEEYAERNSVTVAKALARIGEESLRETILYNKVMDLLVAAAVVHENI